MLPRINSLPSLSFPPAVALGPFALRRIYTGGLSLGASVYARDAAAWVWGARAGPRETYRTALRFEPFDDEQRDDATRRNDSETLSTGDKKDKHNSRPRLPAKSPLDAPRRLAVSWQPRLFAARARLIACMSPGNPTGTERSIFRSMSERFVALSWNEIGILAGFSAIVVIRCWWLGKEGSPWVREVSNVSIMYALGQVSEVGCGLATLIANARSKRY